MKQLFTPIIALAVIGGANAGVLPTYGGEKTGVLPTATSVATPAQIPTKKSVPTDFYISAKGGYSTSFGMIYTNENNNTGFTFSNSGFMYAGAIGLDFNSPKIRLELEIAGSPSGNAKFGGGWDNELHNTVGYTSYVLNFIPYFKINDTMNFNLIVGLGAASLDFKNTDESDDWRFKVGSTAFAANFGLGLEVKLSESFSILPEFRYNLLATTVKPSVFIPFFGWIEGDSQTFLMNNFQLMAGLKYTF